MDKLISYINDHLLQPQRVQLVNPKTVLCIWLQLRLYLFIIYIYLISYLFLLKNCYLAF